MKYKFWRLLCYLVIIIICPSFYLNDEIDAVINIDFAKSGSELSKDMYGIFFEDINHAADGGLYGELIQNRDFEYNRVPEDLEWITGEGIISKNNWKERYQKPDELFSWMLVKKNGAEGSRKQSDEMPLNKTNPKSLELTVTNAKNGSVGIANTGYWGIGINKNKNYMLSFYAYKNKESKDYVLISLEGKDGKVYASKKVSGINTSWKQFNTTLTSAATDSAARLVISSPSKGKMWFDIISLFPQETFMNRKNGMRKDLAEMLVNLHPSFLRFPGGCVAEGATLQNRIQWKKTIGDIAARPGNWNLWRYHSTQGLGFHEFLQLCEDLNISPMYVINVGMACQARTGICAPPEDIDGYVQDALDALEYAMGSPATKWGAMRVKDGHPKPFRIKYVEVGNENHGPFYQKVFAIFQTAIRNKYPTIKTIADEPIAVSENDYTKNSGGDFVDEHYYRSPDFFYEHQNMYDRYDRKKSPEIYVGEFAVTTPDGGDGNMKGALGEAAFMVGMERNADIVKLISYAPTFVNTNDRRWNPDMIVYNSSQCYGTPSYYVLQAFSSNRPNYILSTKTSYKKAIDPINYNNLTGGFSFLSRNTVFNYKEMKVIIDNVDVLKDDFKGGTGKWKIKNDNWVAANGILENKYDEMKSRIDMENNGWKNYTLSFAVKKVRGEENLHLWFLTGGGDKCILNLGSKCNLQQETNGNVKELGTADNTLEVDRWCRIKIEVDEKKVKCFIDDKIVFDSNLKGKTDPEIYSTAGYKKENNEIIIKVVNPLSIGKKCRLNINGCVLKGTGEATVINSINPNDENSFSRPENIKPHLIKLETVSKSFNYESPANSVSILKIKVD